MYNHAVIYASNSGDYHRQVMDFVFQKLISYLAHKVIKHWTFQYQTHDAFPFFQVSIVTAFKLNNKFFNILRGSGDFMV